MIGNTSETPHPRFSVATILLILIGIAPTLSALSYFHARSQADALITSIQNPPPFRRTGSRLILLHDANGRGRFCWEFSYDPKYYFSSGDLQIRVAFDGEIVDPLPSGLTSPQQLP